MMTFEGCDKSMHIVNSTVIQIQKANTTIYLCNIGNVQIKIVIT